MVRPAARRSGAPGGRRCSGGGPRFRRRRRGRARRGCPAVGPIATGSVQLGRTARTRVGRTLFRNGLGAGVSWWRACRMGRGSGRTSHGTSHATSHAPDSSLDLTARLDGLLSTRPVIVRASMSTAPRGADASPAVRLTRVVVGAPFFRGSGRVQITPCPLRPYGRRGRVGLAGPKVGCPTKPWWGHVGPRGPAADTAGSPPEKPMLRSQRLQRPWLFAGPAATSCTAGLRRWAGTAAAGGPRCSCRAGRRGGRLLPSSPVVIVTVHYRA